ncbi:MAG: ribonuclease HII [Terriglobales bacterium]
MPCGSHLERHAFAAGATCVAGVDEVGRGALFGPVVAAAVVLNPHDRIRGLNDSKQIAAPERQKLAARIRQRALAWAVAAADAACIDAINILQASRRAMLEAVRLLPQAPDWVLVDGNCELEWPGRQQAIVDGDALSISVAAASIVAKVHRDALMRRWDCVFPAYDLGSNKGYGSPVHLAALRRCGPSPLHRRSFAPVAALHREQLQ